MVHEKMNGEVYILGFQTSHWIMLSNPPPGFFDSVVQTGKVLLLWEMYYSPKKEKANEFQPCFRMVGDCDFDQNVTCFEPREPQQMHSEKPRTLWFEPIKIRTDTYFTVGGPIVGLTVMAPDTRNRKATAIL
jgi:hypothetical protein